MEHELWNSTWPRAGLFRYDMYVYVVFCTLALRLACSITESKHPRPPFLLLCLLLLHRRSAATPQLAHVPPFPLPEQTSRGPTSGSRAAVHHTLELASLSVLVTSLELLQPQCTAASAQPNACSSTMQTVIHTTPHHAAAFYFLNFLVLSPRVSIRPELATGNPRQTTNSSAAAL